MDLVAFVLNAVIGTLLVGATVIFLAQQEPPSATLVHGVPQDVVESPSASLTPGPCPSGRSDCAGPSYAPPTGSA